MTHSEFGYVAFVHDISDGVYDNSHIELADQVKDFPEYDEENWLYDEAGVYALTAEGSELLYNYNGDCACGYDLCYGRAVGLAREYRNAYDFLPAPHFLPRICGAAFVVLLPASRGERIINPKLSHT